MHIKTTVNRLTTKSKTRDPFAIADQLGIIVIRAPLVGISGFCQYYFGYHIIYINDSLDTDMQRYVCAYGLGHILLHDCTGDNISLFPPHIGNLSQCDVDADRFAAYLCSSSNQKNIK